MFRSRQFHVSAIHTDIVVFNVYQSAVSIPRNMDRSHADYKKVLTPTNVTVSMWRKLEMSSGGCILCKSLQIVNNVSLTSSLDGLPSI